MKIASWLLVVTLALFACSREDKPAASTGLPNVVPLSDTGPSLAALDRGARLFQEHCAQCHGPEGQGHPDWQTPGVVAAPPLNGTGNDVKRTRAELVSVIQQGAKRNGVVVMPAWKERLSETEIQDVMAWFQALWAPDVYSRWERTQGARASR